MVVAKQPPRKLPIFILIVMLGHIYNWY